MSRLWPTVSKEKPCPICQKPDWCALGSRAVKCMRVDSPTPSNDGGWYHFYESLAKGFKAPPPRSSVTPPPVSTIPFGKFMRIYDEQTTQKMLETFANNLGVATDSLQSLGAAWSRDHSAWAFPMRDAYGETTGVRLRALNGSKWSITGSKQGIFAPSVFDGSNGSLAVILEGPTDTAAALSLGFTAIGRPSNNSGNEIVKKWFAINGITRAVISADNDDKIIAGKRRFPGIDGAQNLKKLLGLRSIVWLPQAKDFRKLVQLGATRQMIESEWNNLVWTKG